MIHYDKKLIFIHIPKCGGTSVENALFRPHEKTSDALFTLKGHPDHDKYETGGLQHLSASKVREVVGGNIYDEFYKFAVVRHPVKRLISQFNYTYQFPYFGRKSYERFRIQHCISVSENDFFWSIGVYAKKEKMK